MGLLTGPICRNYGIHQLGFDGVYDVVALPGNKMAIRKHVDILDTSINRQHSSTTTQPQATMRDDFYLQTPPSATQTYLPDRTH